MPKIIPAPAQINAAGTDGKIIEEFFGAVNSKSTDLSIARMKSQQGWDEPGQCPEFDEYTLILSGTLQVRTKKEMFLVVSGQAILCKAGEWIQYSTPFAEGAEYISVCVPAFSIESVHRDEPVITS